MAHIFGLWEIAKSSDSKDLVSLKEGKYIYSKDINCNFESLNNDFAKANYFASCLLMPKELVIEKYNQFGDLVKMKQEFRVSSIEIIAKFKEIEELIGVVK